jgi:hypothetical protein
MEIASIESAVPRIAYNAFPSAAFQLEGMWAVSEEPKKTALEQEKTAEKERVRKAREAAKRGRDVLFVENLGAVASKARHETAKILATTGLDRTQLD